MKQKVVVKAIISSDDKILLLRRHGGRPSIDGLFELPGGRVHIHQQPEDALNHALTIHIGASSDRAQLADVMTFIDPDDREIQYVFIVFNTTINPRDDTISLSHEYDKYVWKKMSDIQRDEITQSTQQILGLQPIPYATGRKITDVERNDDKKSTYVNLVGYSDGASRGNPGPAAAGFVLMDTTEKIIADGGAYVGITTNHVAEYQAVYLALQRALRLGVSVLDMRLDSKLVVDQMNGVHAVKEPDLLAIHKRTRELMCQFEKVTFTHVLREYNFLADGIVNKILDEQFGDEHL